MTSEWQRGDFTISTDPARLDRDMIYEFLANSYWAAEIPRGFVERSIAHSLSFGVYHGDQQVGFARVISDRATFAYLADVFILEEFRGRGLSKWLMEAILEHPELQDLRRWLLATADAHGLYRQFGFTDLTDPSKFLTRGEPGLYRRMAEERARDAE
jgi:GNAT superfamily N-acetyltransferase